MPSLTTTLAPALNAAELSNDYRHKAQQKQLDRAAYLINETIKTGLRVLILPCSLDLEVVNHLQSMGYVYNEVFATGSYEALHIVTW